MKRRAPLLLGTIFALLAIMLVPRRVHEPEPAFEPPTVVDEPASDATEELPPEPILEPPVSVRAEDEVAEQASFVEGFARDEDGKGIPRVKVTEERAFDRRRGLRAPPTARNQARERTAETRDDGHYRLEEVDRELVNIKFSHERYVTTWLSDILAGSTDANVVMKRRGAISGTVLDKATGDPITDFTIAVGFLPMGPRAGRYFSGGFGGHRYFGQPESFHSETGEFTVVPNRLGKVALRASAFGYAEETVYLDEELTSGEQIRDVEIRLAPGATIRGTVVAAADSEPVAEAEVYWRSSSPNAAWQPRTVQAVTDEDGAFLIADLRAGEWHFGVKHPGFAPSGVISVELKEGQEQEVTIRLEAGGTIAGYVTVNGKPEAGVKIRSSGPERLIREITTDEDGYYELAGAEAGRHGLSARDRHHASVDVEPGRITRQDFEFETGTGAIEGYVLLNGEPFREEAVHVTVNPIWVEASYYAKERTVKTDQDGYYRVDELAPDTYAIFTQIDHMTRGAVVEVRDRRAVRLDLEFQTGTASITGTVSWPEPYEGAFVAVRDALDTEPVSADDFLIVVTQALAVGECDSEGRFEIEDLQAGSYNVTAVCLFQRAGWPFEDIRQASRIVTVELDAVVELNFDL
jgi:hypothetical protein